MVSVNFSSSQLLLLLKMRLGEVITTSLPVCLLSLLSFKNTSGVEVHV